MDNAIVGGITSVGTLGTNSSTITVSSATTSNTAILRPKVEDVLDRYELNGRAFSGFLPTRGLRISVLILIAMCRVQVVPLRRETSYASHWETV